MTIANLTAHIAQVRKAVAAIVGVALMLVTSGVLDGTVAAYVQTAIAALTALGVYVAPNGSSSEGVIDGTTETGTTNGDPLV